MKRKALTAVAAVLALGLTAACGGGGRRPGEAAELDRSDQGLALQQPRGGRLGQGDGRGVERRPLRPAGHGQEIPAGKSSEEVIGAAITAGNAPCLVFNTSPAAVPQFQQQGGLVALDDFTGGRSYIEERSGDSPSSTRRPTGSTTSCRGSRTR